MAVYNNPPIINKRCYLVQPESLSKKYVLMVEPEQRAQNSHAISYKRDFPFQILSTICAQLRGKILFLDTADDELTKICVASSSFLLTPNSSFTMALTGGVRSTLEWTANLSTVDAPVPNEKTKYMRKVRLVQPTILDA